MYQDIDVAPLIAAFQGLSEWFEAEITRAKQLCAEDKPHTLISSKDPCVHFRKERFVYSLALTNEQGDKREIVVHSRDVVSYYDRRSGEQGQICFGDFPLAHYSMIVDGQVFEVHILHDGATE